MSFKYVLCYLLADKLGATCRRRPNKIEILPPQVQILRCVNEVFDEFWMENSEKLMKIVPF